MRRCTLPLLLLCPFLLAGCWNGRVLYSFERPFRASLGDETAVRTALTRIALTRGFMPRMDPGSLSPDPLDALTKEVATRRYGVVVVGPLLSFEWMSFVAKYPKTRFILIDAPVPSEDPPGNAIFLSFDRTAAFRGAGRAAGRSVRARHHGAADPGSRIVALVGASTGLPAEEVEAFSDGVAETLGGSRPLIRAFARPVEKEAVKSMVQQQVQAGAEMFLLGLGELDPWGLAVIRDAGASAVVADWAMSGTLASNVFLSVEEDVPGGIARALDATPGTLRVQGPVRLVNGQAR